MTSRMQNSSGVDTPVANLDVFLNTNANAGSPLPVTWSSVGGTLSGQQTPLQSSGGFAQVMATYLGTAALASNSATAKVDNDSTSGSSNTGLITVNKGNTSSSIISQDIATTLTGQTFTVNFNALPTNTTNSPTVMGGNVTVSDGVNNCSGAIDGSGNGSCSLALNTAGVRSLTATYTGDANFNASAASPSLSHTVTNVATWVGGASTNWTLATNWGTGAVPGSIHDVNIPAGALTNEPTIPAVAVTITNLTIGSGHVLTVNSGGSLTASGTSTVNGDFGGSGGSFSFNNLTIANAAGVSLGGNATVSGTLALSSGDLNMGANVLSQPSSAPASTGTGDVIGSVRRTGGPTLPNSVLTYGNPNNQITLAGSNLTSLTLALTKSTPTSLITGQANSDFPGAVQRTYQLTPSGTFGSATLQLHYLTSELNGNSEATPGPPASLKLFRLIATGWELQDLASGFANTTLSNASPDNWVKLTGVTGFSFWAISGVSPTAADGDVSGCIVDTNGKPVEGAGVRMSGTQERLTVTDAGGNYHFDNLQANGFYTVAPTRTNYNFSPAQRSFSQLGAHTDAGFTGVADGGAESPLDATEYFVRQQYVDFLGREPDEAGFNFWVNNIESCGGDAQCRDVKRIDTSAAFFLSIEFQHTGYLVYRSYQAAYGDLAGAPVPLTRGEFAPDTREISNGVIVGWSGWEQRLAGNQTAYENDFVQRPRFTAAYPTTLSPREFVDQLFAHAGISTADSDYAAAIAEFNGAGNTADISARARALRQVAENSSLAQQEFDSAFVLMQYFGYLQRDANTGPDSDFTGFNFWVGKLDIFGSNYQQAEMVKAFLVSDEYRGRFPK